MIILYHALVDDNRETLPHVRDVGYETAFATNLRKFGSDESLEAERIGVDSTSLWKLQGEVAGVATVSRPFGVRVG